MCLSINGCWNRSVNNCERSNVNGFLTVRTIIDTILWNFAVIVGSVSIICPMLLRTANSSSSQLYGLAVFGSYAACLRVSLLLDLITCCDREILFSSRH